MTRGEPELISWRAAAPEKETAKEQSATKRIPGGLVLVQ